MTEKIGKKIEQLNRLHMAWRDICAEGSAVDEVREAVEQAIIAVSQDLVKEYEGGNREYTVTDFENKIREIKHMCDAWSEVYDYDADALGFAQECIEKAIVSAGEELIEIDRAGVKK